MSGPSSASVTHTYRSFPSGRFMTKPKYRRIDSGNHLCSYVHRICLQNRLEGFDYCIRHILEDRSAPFRQCSYVHPQSNKRCPNAARRTDRRDSTLCPWHIKKLYLKRKQALLHQIRIQSEGNLRDKNLKKLFRDLEQYCPNESHDRNRVTCDWVQQDDGSITASDILRHKIADAASNLNINDEIEDQCANASVDDVMRTDIMESDSESIDSDYEDPLKHAGVYTAEEVSLVLRDKMLRLQSLYIEQFKHLQFLLREKRKKYFQNLKHEKEIPGNSRISQIVSSDGVPTQVKADYAKLKAMCRYHRAHGPEVLLKMQAREKRKAAIEGDNYELPSHPKCIFVKDDISCNNRSLPLTNYCKTHILYDIHQILFRPCAAGTPPCLNPIISFVYKNTCLSHRDLKIDRQEINKRNDDEPQMGSLPTEPELFQTVDDIASLGLMSDVVNPDNFYNLDQLGDLASADLLN